MPFSGGGAASGAMSGATAGSAFGPIGMGIGALGGGLLGGLFGGGDDNKPAVRGNILGTNPASGVLAELFGYFPYMDSNGRIKYKAFNENDIPLDRTNSLFGSNFKGDVRDYINNFDYQGPSVSSIADLYNMAPGLLDQTLGIFQNDILPGAQNLVNTGFRTDIKPVQDYAERMFMRQDLPNIAELFAGQTGTMSSDFLQGAVNAATDMRYQLGALQAQYDESANQRRAQGLPVYGQLATTMLGLPTATASDMAAGGKSLLDLQTQLDPGYRGLGVFGTLAGLGAPGNMGPIASGYQPSQTSNLLTGLGQLAPGFATAVGSAFPNSSTWLKNLFTSNSNMPAGSSNSWPMGGPTSAGFGGTSGYEWANNTVNNLWG